mmetsp:Transcript_93798/g.183919  ORF Transcript_93798/g.183919 Transcript_93798/m.183919 type:complete len:105 (+) Transcript_93798:102-416(+)|eukprot:CAMPEP_0170395246 /NCGR_PEP_ID=MMETSP0117_2-20130122/21674_1 /TAXON_ID=400756 /ORGANISM="Durinskia baltica, Strain CSIRO CS-38" /LENGTH=104 /DNA_ID=CAMNT_0010651539 /DNA_START=103 /DNA_END=417 /DNA_ORIENTATION=-
MKRTQRCFDFLSLEQEKHHRDDTKRFRAESEQTDLSMESELSEISEKFDSSTSITPTSSLKCGSLELGSIKCEFTFQPEDFSIGRNSRGRSGLDSIIRKNLINN